MSWCQPNEIRFEALTVEFLSALSQFGLKAFAMINVLDTLEKNRGLVCFWIFFPNSPCQHLPISCSTKVVAWFAGYFAVLGVQAASLARCCSQYLYFRTLQKFRWDLVVFGECIT